MPRKNLTDAFLKNGAALPAGSKQTDYWDSRTPGFGIRISPGGAKTWMCLGRKRSGERWIPARVTLGRYPALSLADARKKADEVLSKLKAGETPQEIKAAAERAVDERQSLTIERVSAAFIEHQKKIGRRAWKGAESHLQRDVIPLWKGRPIEDIRKSDIRKVLDRVMARNAPYLANRTLSTIARLFSWAVSAGIIESSPAIGVEKPGQETTRDRILSKAEIRAFWSSTGAMGWPFGSFLQILFLTAQRRGELAAASWSDITLDGNAPAWVIPAKIAKNGREHRVPLAPAVVAMLRCLPTFAPDAKGLVFSTNGRTPISGYSKASLRLDSLMETALGPIPQWQVHDLRRTAATGMAEAGIPPHVVEAVLNHKSGTISGVGAIYNRFRYEAEMREALQKWAAVVADPRFS